MQNVVITKRLVEKAHAWLRDNGNPKRAEYAHMWFTERILRIARPKETMDLNVSGPSPEQVALLEALKLTPYERRKVLEAQDSTAAEDADAGPPEPDEAELPIE
mgnify:CR=1 FL=1